MKRWMMVLLALLAVLLLCACGEKEPEYGLVRDGDNLKLILPGLIEPAEIPVKEMTADALSAYQIVRSDTGDQNEIEAALTVRRTITEKIGEIGLTTDWVKRGEEAPVGTKEILVGRTNRAENPGERVLRRGDYLICFENDRLVICGGTTEDTLKAAECFAQYFIDSKTGTLLLPDGAVYLYQSEQLSPSFTLNGVELYDYAVEAEYNSLSAAAESVRQFILEVTGLSPMEKSENRIVIGSKAAADSCTVKAEGNVIRIDGSETMDASVATRYFLSQLISLGGFTFSESGQHAAVQLDALNLSGADLAKMEPVTLHVAVDGDDAADGSEAAPLATFEGARLRVREVMKTTPAPIEVIFHGGEYMLTEQVKFNAADSGSEAAPITYRAADGEDVRFVGGVKVDPALVKKAENPAIVSRVLDKSAAEKLMQIDLSAVIPMFHKVYSYGNTGDNSQNPITVYINGNPLDRSRWPNEGTGNDYLLTDKKLDNHDDGSKTIYYMYDAAKRIATWSEDALKDLYIFGFLSWDWYNEDFEATNIDTKQQSITLTGGLTYYDSIAGSQRYYFFNLPEEIDVPGESYVDRESRIVYFLPEDDFDANEIYVSTLVDSMLQFSGTKNIIIEDLNFLYTRGNAIYATETDNFTVRGCTIAHTSHNGASLSGTRITFADNHIYDTARGGVSVSGGDRTTLTSGESIVENCEIHDINRDQSTYKPGISASSQGLVIRNNKLYNCVHEMIAVGSNDVVIEYNEFFNCVTNSSDMGAIYFGRNPSLMGTVIRYNYFHQIGNPYGNIGSAHGGIGQQSIFIDDGNNGAEIYGNVFWQGTYDSAAIKTHGAQFSEMTGNIFIDMPAAYQNSDWVGSSEDGVQQRWWLWLYDRINDGEHAIINKIQSVKFDSEIWREHYDGTIWAQLYDYIDSERIEEYTNKSDDEMNEMALELGPVKSNVLSGNVMVKLTAVAKGGVYTGENNLVTDDTGIFKKFGEDFTLTDAALAEIRKTIPDFENIPFDKIGLQK